MDEKQTMVRKECANDLAVSIYELAKKEGYQIDGFCLEVSIPSFIVEKDNAIRLRLISELAPFLVGLLMNLLSFYAMN